MQNPPAQEVHQVTFVAVGDVKTDTAQLLTYDGQRTEQEATKISIPGEWSLLLLRGAGTKTGQYSSLILVAYYKMSYKQNTAPQSWFQKSTKITEFGKVYLGSTIVIDHPLHFWYWQNRAYHGRTLMNGFGCTCWAYSLYSYIVARTGHIIISAHEINISLPFLSGKLGITLWHHPGVVDIAGYTSQKFQWLLLSWPPQIHSVELFGEGFT